MNVHHKICKTDNPFRRGHVFRVITTVEKDGQIFENTLSGLALNPEDTLTSFLRLAELNEEIVIDKMK